MPTDPPAAAAVAVSSRVIGKLKEFNPKVDQISSYLERLELYFEANDIREDKKVAVLLTVIGPSTYETLRSLLAPTKPKDKTFQVLKETLTSHYDPKPLVIGERYRFYQRVQKPNESIADFVADLRRLSIHCEFENFLDQALRDRFVCGVKSDSLQKRLLTEADLTIEKAQTIAQGMELADRNSKDLKSSESAAAAQSLQSTNTNPVSYVATQCYRCGRRHDEKQCKHRKSKCHRCGKVGHIAPVCGQAGKFPKATNPPSSSTHVHKSSRKRKPGGVHHYVCGDESAADSDQEMEPMFYQTTASTPPPIEITMEINDHNVTFEVDTGATVTIMSEGTLHSLFPNIPIEESTVQLKTYTGESMDVAGKVTVSVRYLDQPAQELTLTVVKSEGPTLLGRDWLQHFKLDWASIKAVVLENDPLSKLLSEYDEVFKDELGTVKPVKARLSVSPDATPRFHRPRTVPYALRPAVEAELDRLEKIGVLEKVTHSDWAAPIVVVPKKDGQVRICGDYKVTVNPSLNVDQYPLPRPEDLFATLAGGKYFSTLDLSHAYNQLPLEEESRKFLTINTHRGLYRYTRMPFGVASAPAIFQKTMDSILQGLDGVICYIDDILVTGKTPEEHMRNLEKVLQRLREHGLRVKKTKCSFLKPSVQYLGHRIDSEGIHATDSKLTAITGAPTPQNQQELRSFLGLLNYYGKFIPNLSSLLHPLNALLCNDTAWHWTTECQKAFDEAKAKIVSPNVLVHYDATLPIKLAGDASAYGIGAVISHVMPNGTEHPIAFASRTLLPSERNYSQIEKEALSLVYGVNKFHTYLYGRSFVLVTDHKPLTTILGPKKGVPATTAARLTRWAVQLSAYSYRIEFRSTAEHGNADGLSRLPLNRLSTVAHTPDPAVFNMSQVRSLPLTAKQLATATRQDVTLSKVYNHITKGWPNQVEDDLKAFFTRRNELTVENGCVLWGIRVVIPDKFREKLLSELHHDHLGIVKMKSIARSYFWWPKLDSSIESLAKSCQDCLAVKGSPPSAPLQPWSWPSRVFERVHIDFAGPFQGSMFLVAVDAYSKWPEVFMMSNSTVPTTLDALRQMFARYGLPEQIVSDNGSQFTANEFSVFLEMNGVKHIRSAPYHPATNGLAERFVQSLKHALKASVGSGLPLSQRLSNFLFKYRFSEHSTTGVSPSSLFLKREMRTRFDLLKPDLSAQVKQKQNQQKASHDQHAKSRNFAVGDSVMVKNFRPGHDWVPAVVVAKLGPLSYLVETDDHQTWRRHVDHVKARVSSPNDSNSDWQPAGTLVAPTVTDLVPDTSDNVEQLSNQEQSDLENSQNSSAAKRYPRRERRPPDYYNVSV